MLRKLVLACVVAALAVAGGTVALAGGSGDQELRRAQSASPKVVPLTDLVSAPRAATDTATAARACQTLRCINRRLATLTRQVGNLRSFVSCLGAVGMSSYGEDPNGGTYGFVWRDDTVPEEYLSTALDFDGSDTPHVFTIVYAC